jgi:hypothetical protein
MTTSTIGCLKSRDNRSIPKITLMPNQLLQEFRAKWTKYPQKMSVILANRNLSKKEKKIEQILDSK